MAGWAAVRGRRNSLPEESGPSPDLSATSSPISVMAGFVSKRRALLRTSVSFIAATVIIKSGAEGERVLEALLRLTDRVITGQPDAQPQPFMGPVIDNETADRLMESFVASIKG